MEELCSAYSVRYEEDKGLVLTQDGPCPNTLPCPRHTKVTVTLERLTDAMRISTDEALRRYYASRFRESWNQTDPKFLALLFETLSAAAPPAPNSPVTPPVDRDA